MLHYSLSFIGFLLFAVVHSITAQDAFKSAFLKRFPIMKHYYRAIYSLISVLYLGAWYYYLPPISVTFYSVEKPYSHFFDVVRIVSVIGLTHAVYISYPFIFIGLKQIFLHKEHPFHLDEPKMDNTLRIRSVYRFMRHPMYFWSILYVLMNPNMTDRNLYLFVLFTAYFYWGSFPEEKKLEERFGTAYTNYKNEVPRLIPSFKRFKV
ncbi:hypothetical protein EP331_04600 [bacterium]|nr:MAG: hypothetical protein EP331_04600 [bacterium]